MSRKTLPYKNLYLILFLISVVGFGYHFSSFAKSNWNYVFGGSVAGISNYKANVTVEVRTNNKLLSEQIVSSLKPLSNVTVTKVSYTSKSYADDLLVDMSDGSKVAEISELENEVKLGASIDLPVGESSTDADVLLIVTTK